VKNEPRIVWRGCEPSPALEERIERELQHLDKTWRRITSVRVAIEQPHRHHRHGSHYVIKIEVSAPGRVLAVTGDSAANANAEDAYAAVNDAFATMQRQLEDYVHIRRHMVKHHRGDEARGRRRVTPQ
jgi:ribosome-associated translation inhibitor RaiA